MKAIYITMNDINGARKQGYSVYGIKKGFCDLISSCEECNKKVRRLCKKICKIEDKQIKLIKALAKKNEKRIMEVNNEQQ